MAGVAEVGFSEHQAVADVADVAPLAQQLEVPRAVDGVAVKHAADKLVVLDDEPLVDAAERIREHDLFALRTAGEGAGREQIDAGHLELRRRDRAGVAPDAVQREMIRADLGHLEQRCDQAVRDADD